MNQTRLWPIGISVVVLQIVPNHELLAFFVSLPMAWLQLRGMNRSLRKKSYTGFTFKAVSQPLET
ncbi:MAG: hypothetical protein DMG88_18500 [Acidobacteria bacterium]|nr:MAG: hypothetical protein DMG88_18500 [Acidobacteriota bacterium]